MANLFQNTYRIPTARLQRWDYSKEGMYFVTICTENKKNYFGSIKNSSIGYVPEIITPNMELSILGNVVLDEWIKTVLIRKDMNLELGEFVVMPNHFHGIMVIGENQFNETPKENEINKPPNKKSVFSAQSKNLASIIRGYKSSVTNYARKNNIEFNWQSRFHEHIIRSKEELDSISKYILNNPMNWAKDEFFTG